MTLRRLERIEDPETALLQAFSGHQAGVWTALPATVKKVNLASMTVECEAATKIRVRQLTGSFEWVTIPLLTDVPIVFPSGGGFTLTFPVAVGDECLVVFASRCIDSWWQLSGTQQLPDLRMHDLSDGFALVGPRSRPRVLASVSTTDVELRNEAGTSKISIKPSGDVSVTTAASVTIQAANVNITGNVSITGSLTNNGKDVGSTHKHSGVQAGGSNTGNPI